MLLFLFLGGVRHGETGEKYSGVSQWACRRLRSAFEGILITRLRAKGGGGTPRLAKWSVERLRFLSTSDGISLDYNYKQSLYNNYIYVLSIRGYSK